MKQTQAQPSPRYRGLRTEGELAWGMDRVRTRVRVRPAGGRWRRELALPGGERPPGTGVASSRSGQPLRLPCSRRAYPPWAPPRSAPLGQPAD